MGFIRTIFILINSKYPLYWDRILHQNKTQSNFLDQNSILRLFTSNVWVIQKKEFEKNVYDIEWENIY